MAYVPGGVGPRLRKFNIERVDFLSAEELRRILHYEAGLDRQFRSKLQQFLGWRRAKEGLLLYTHAQPEGERTSPKRRGLSARAAEPLSVGEAIDFNISG